MSDSENLELNFIQEYLKTISGKVLLFSNDSKMISSLYHKTTHVISNTDEILSNYIDNLLFTNTFQKNLFENNQKFDLILIQNLFDQVTNPELFIQSLISILNENGKIICSISNFYHTANILNILIGNICELSNMSQFYNLDKFLLFLNKNNAHITKISRMKKDFQSSKMNIDMTLIPSQLIEIIKKIPDYDTDQYILMIGKGKIAPSENLEFVSTFPKNYLFPKLQEFFEKFSELENSITDKDKIIQGHENSIEEQRAYIENLEDYIENLEEHIRNLDSQLKKLKFWKR